LRLAIEWIGECKGGECKGDIHRSRNEDLIWYEEKGRSCSVSTPPLSLLRRPALG
jgi:hypothetical protein